ncbi:zinc finger MYM-type protein 1-like [Dendropsophus ebraccatus]|uniref:zinc finger MYM-type protein 1-like n=1 Tax=Dendropsophus ebraccatus TaxID=150705 RepID=UPI0038311C7B
MDKKYKSGALKRKEREQKKRQLNSCTPLTKFFFVSQPPAPSEKNNDVSHENQSGSLLVSNLEDTTTIVHDNTQVPLEHSQESQQHDNCSSDKDIADLSNPIASLNTPNSPTNQTDELDGNPGLSSSASGPDGIFTLNTEEPYPTDPCLFINNTLTTDIVRVLLEHGPCQPGLNDHYDDFPYNLEKRRFNPSWYNRKVGDSCTVIRQWLIYSPKSNRLYCFCCWLFCLRNEKVRVWADPDMGFFNFKKGLEKIEQHERCNTHRESEKTFLLTKYRISKDSTVIAGLIRGEREKIENNRKILHRLIDVTLFLAKQGLAFRGHREHSGLGDPNVNEGNFLELLKLLGQYDCVLEHHLKNPGSHVRYLSSESQNELISALACEALSTIINEVKSANFFSVIVDSTIDVTRIDQFSLSLRYVTEAGNITERFVKFEKLADGCAESFYDILINILAKELGLNLSLMRGQAYDGARTMSGHLMGLQARVKQQCSEKAFYVHCCAHNLNLVLIDAVCALCSVKNFFGTLETLYLFLTSSLPRYRILEEEQNKILEGTVLTLKRLSDTRWASRKQATEAVIKSLPAIVEALCRIKTHNASTPKTAAEADGLVAKLTTYEFKLMLVFWNTLLSKTYVLSNYLQKESLDINTAVHLIDACMTQIRELRSDEAFAAIENAAMDLATKCNHTTSYHEGKVRKRKRFFDENAEDEPIVDSRARFRTEVFYYIIDVFVEQFEHRFSDFREIAKLFCPLNSKYFHESDVTDKVIKLARFYSGDVCTEPEVVLAEFLTLCDMYSELSIEKEMVSTEQILPFLIANDMHRAFPNLSILYRIYLTIPVSSAKAERSFSRLKLIKTRLRTCMHEARLSNLTLLSIERDIEIDKDKVVGRFSKVKQRKMAL